MYKVITYQVDYEPTMYNDARKDYSESCSIPSETYTSYKEACIEGASTVLRGSDDFDEHKLSDLLMVRTSVGTMYAEDQIKHLVEKYTTVSMNDKEFLSALYDLNPLLFEKAVYSWTEATNYFTMCVSENSIIASAESIFKKTSSGDWVSLKS
jgi:hypothetical protein